MTFVLTATKVLNILSKTLKDAVSGFFEFYSLREGGGLLKKLYLKPFRMMMRCSLNLMQYGNNKNENSGSRLDNG